VQNLLSSSLLSKNTKIKIHRTVILPAVLYGCGAWSLTLRKEHRLREVMDRVLRKMCGPRRDKVEGEWRRLHSEKLCRLFSSPNMGVKIKKKEMGGAYVALMGDWRVVHRVLVGKHEEKEATWMT
jgi:hypothetical protein